MAMNRPELAVVVPSVNGIDDLVGCLRALEALRSEVTLEIVVVDRLGEEVRQRAAETSPDAKILAVPLDTTIPDMRALAFKSVTGQAVAVIEDHVIVPPGWGRTMVDALANGAEVVGGPVENAATDTLMDWATFLCEYSHCIPPLPEGRVEWLPGNNVGYRSKILEDYRAVTEEGRWENRLHDQLKADGKDLICRGDLTVGHKKHYTFGEYFSQRYLYARSYAGARVAGMPGLKRFAYGAAAFILPPLLFYRTVRRIWGKGRHKWLLVKSLPLIGIFVTSWGFGEIVGYWFGAGNSLAKVR